MEREDIQLVVKETLSSLGFTVDDPNEMQQDIAYIRDFRKGSQAIKSNIITALITITLPGVIYLLWQTVKTSLNIGVNT